MNLILTLVWLSFTTFVGYFFGNLAGFGAVGLFWSSVAGFVVGLFIRVIFAKAGSSSSGSKDDGFFGGVFDSDSSCSGGSCGGGGD